MPFDVPAQPRRLDRPARGHRRRQREARRRAAGRSAVAAGRVPQAPARQRLGRDAVPGRRGRRARRQARARPAGQRARQAAPADRHTQRAQRYKPIARTTSHRPRGSSTARSSMLVRVRDRRQQPPVTGIVKATPCTASPAALGVALVVVLASAALRCRAVTPAPVPPRPGPSRPTSSSTPATRPSAFITSAGEVRPGWDTKRIALEGDAVWSALRLADGTVLLGTDAKAARSTGRQNDTAEEARRAARGDRGGRARADRGRRGVGRRDARQQVWKIDVAAGKASTLAELKDVETVWSLATAGNTLYAGTGPYGQAVRDHRARRAKQVFDTDDKRITALAATSDGGVWMGTSDARSCSATIRGQARRARWPTSPATRSPRSRRTATASSPPRTISQARRPAGQDQRRSSRPSRSRPRPRASRRSRRPAAPSRAPTRRPRRSPTSAARARRRARARCSASRGDGRLDQLHALTATYFTSVASNAAGQVYAGAADKGRVYMVDPDDSVATAFDVDERSVVAAVARAGRHVAFATDDAAALYRATGHAPQATLHLRRARRQGAVSRFGKLGVAQRRARSSSRPAAATPRSPGVGWSEWQTPRDASAAGGGASAARSRARRAATCSSAPRSRTTTRVLRETALLRAAEPGDPGHGGHRRAGDQGRPSRRSRTSPRSRAARCSSSSGRSRTPTATTPSTRSASGATARRTGGRSRPARRR